MQRPSALTSPIRRVNRPVPWNFLPRCLMSALAIRLQPWDKPGAAWHYMERTTSIGTSRVHRHADGFWPPEPFAANIMIGWPDT